MATQTVTDRLYLALQDAKNLALLRRAAITMWLLQTPEERTARETFRLNARGLDSADGRGFVGRICHELSESPRMPTGGEAMVLAEYLPKYASQLVRFLQSEGSLLP